MNDIKIKLITLFLLLISFILIIYYLNKDSYISNITVKEIKANRTLNEELIDELKINGIPAIYDKITDMYFYTIPSKNNIKKYNLRIDTNKGYKYKINDQKTTEIKVDYEKPLNIIIYNDKYYYETTIQLTNLPLVKIDTECVINREDCESAFEYIDGSSKVKTYSSKIHIRGATSLKLPKKSYKIDIYDNKYNNTKNILIDGFSNQDSFILDGIYKDTSKIRNVLSTELWNSVSRDFLEVIVNYKFVELFINNEYKGLYVLTDPINRKKLNLKKSEDDDTSIVIKDSSWDSINSYDDLDIKSMEYAGNEIKYPNTNEYNDKIWPKVLSKLSTYYDGDTKYDVVKEVFNMNNYIDIVIFNAFINNVDNHLAKNNYFYMESINDDEIFIQPWDMEFSFGLIYDSKPDLFSKKKLDDYDEVKTPFKFDLELNKLIIKRYWVLRKTVLTKEYFDKLLDEYLNELNKGAAKRDSNLWYEYDIKEEIKEIRNWIYKRLDFFDEYIRGLEDE